MRVFVGFFLFFVVNAIASKAQFINDIRGRPVTTLQYENLSGSPFYSDKYLKGTVNIKGNIKVIQVYLKLDQVKDILLAKNNLTSETPIEITDDVLNFKLIGAEGDTTMFKRVPNGDGYYEVLYNGKTSLLKRTKKKILETPVYNSAAIEKSAVSTISYFILTKEGKLVPIKLDKNSFLSALDKDKVKDIEQYVSKEKLGFKNELNLKKITGYYNTLN
ncbi:hypothetical protein [Pedobacter sp. Hv1]|uniref:hypothetical protein n=1 Tax=Pedobacter sp. Hv1 TaxID=1740090 RepID=UPI0006D8B324|nr:hypothetical protein [Pedobacter sp. Hv1]KQC01468.1 hypothetical protein AQF98_07110 [Pedobacter sp. Hv1]